MKKSNQMKMSAQLVLLAAICAASVEYLVWRVVGPMALILISVSIIWILMKRE